MNAPNDPNSIMDWFKRHGMDGSYAARARHFFNFYLIIEEHLNKMLYYLDG